MSWVGDLDAAVERLERDPELRLMVEVSARWGTRPSRVLDEWSEDDATKAMALVILERKKEAATCHMCGTPPADWLDEKGRTKNPPPFMVEWETCHGCAAKDRARAEHGEEADSSTRPHLIPYQAASTQNGR